MTDLRFSNLDRVLWPETGFTKGDMVDYYSAIAPVLVPHLRGRPLTLARFPTGVHEKGWYQTNCRGAPSWMHVADVPQSRGARVFRMCVVDDVDSLLWVVNQGTVEQHPYLSLADAFDEPLVLVFDLDPGEGRSLTDCCEVAQLVREVLDRDHLRACVKTSGSSGLHLYVGLAPGATFAQTRAYARAVAGVLAEGRPDLVTDGFTHAERRGRVLIDWRQNERGRSQIAPYSLRATPWPLVSTPLTWDEIEAASDVDLLFSPRAVLGRVAQAGDVFAPALERNAKIRVDDDGS